VAPTDLPVRDEPGGLMSDEFLYLSRTQLEMKDGFRNAYLGNNP
jgi:hypothetical protein